MTAIAVGDPVKVLGKNITGLVVGRIEWIDGTVVLTILPTFVDQHLSADVREPKEGEPEFMYVHANESDVYRIDPRLAMKRDQSRPPATIH